MVREWNIIGKYNLRISLRAYSSMMTSITRSLNIVATVFLVNKTIYSVYTYKEPFSNPLSFQSLFFAKISAMFKLLMILFIIVKAKSEVPADLSFSMILLIFYSVLIVIESKKCKLFPFKKFQKNNWSQFNYLVSTFIRQDRIVRKF